MNQIPLNAERLLSLESTPESVAELMLLVMLKSQHEQIVIEKRGRFVYPRCGSDHCGGGLAPFPARLAGRVINHYRHLSNIQHPTKKGWFTCALNGATADFAFQIASPGTNVIATIIVLDNSINTLQCTIQVNAYFKARESDTKLVTRVWDWIFSWWAGDNLHRQYGITNG